MYYNCKVNVCFKNQYNFIIIIIYNIYLIESLY